MTTNDLIRRIDDVELPTPGRWGIAAQQPVSLRTVGLRRRTIAGTVSGGVTIAEDPSDSTLDLFVSPGGADGAEHDMAIHATLTSARGDGCWRFHGVGGGHDHRAHRRRRHVPRRLQAGRSGAGLAHRRGRPPRPRRAAPAGAGGRRQRRPPRLGSLMAGATAGTGQGGQCGHGRCGQHGQQGARAALLGARRRP